MQRHSSVIWQGLGRAILAILISSLAGVDAGAAEIRRSDLTGTVRNWEGEAVSGATVFIYTASPREGAGVLCPSCYADCRKRTTTDARGRFLIRDLDASLLFRVLVASGDYQPKFVDKVDPGAKDLEIELKPTSLGDTPETRMRGRVVDAEGEPVSGAVINIRGVTRGESTRFGGNRDIDPVTVTDDSGKFVIRGEAPFAAVGVDVEARAFAKGIFQRLTTGDTVHELKLTEGASVKGRLMKEGAPVPHAEVGIAGADRRSEIFVGDYSVATDKEGWFLFVNLPPRTDYFIYGKMKSLGSRGAVPARRVRTEDDGSILNAGDLKLEPAFTLAGQLRLTDGGSIPPKTRVFLGRDEAWDHEQLEVDSQGKFRFEGVPPESISLSVRIPGYRLSMRNASLDRYHLIGRIRSDKTDLIVELEPGPQHDPNISGPTGLAEEPLRGAEAQGPSGDIKVSGTVVDAETGKPLPSFTVTEGRADQYRNDFNWFSTRKTPQSNGTFTVYFVKRREAPGVMVEADGYIPYASGGIVGPVTNLNVALKKGSGPAGILLTPEGQPANGVTVYLTDMRNGVYVSGEKMEVRQQVYRGTRSTRTDESGRFSFTPQVDAYGVIVVDDAGYLEARVEDLAPTKEVRLQRWARVEGRLMIGTKPGATESVRLWPAHVPYANHPRSFPPLQLYLNTTTDEEGRFVFEHVPPIDVEVYHEPKVRDSRMGTTPMSQTTKFRLNPGETREVTIGGKGRPVIGRVTVNGYEGKIDWRADVHNLELIVPEPPDLPDFKTISKEYGEALRAAKTDEEKEAARAELDRRQKQVSERLRQFYASEAGRQYHFAKRRYALNFAQDGSFRVEDVPGGKYTLKIDLREAGGDGPSRFSAPKIGDLNKEIEVPESAGGRSDDPFDVGQLEIQARNVLKPGKTVPDFEVTTLADKKLKLSDLKGKFVLLDFWAVWCGPCVAETPHLKETYDAFKDDPRFAMLGLSLDPEAAAPRDYAKKNQLGWMQGFLGEWSKTDLPARYGVEGIPAIFLVGPDGKLVSSGLRGPAIKSAVEAALKSNRKE